jgi:hypothetical protein
VGRTGDRSRFPTPQCAGVDAATLEAADKSDRHDPANLVCVFRAADLTLIHVRDEREEAVRVSSGVVTTSAGTSWF